MRAIMQATGEDAGGAIPVSPVKIDLAELAGPLTSRSERLRFAATFALCLALHAALLLLLEPRTQDAQLEEAIPVEIIVEPPPEEPPPPEQAKPEEPQPEKPAQVIDEKPATDFARAADQDREDGKASEPSAAEVKDEPQQAQPQEEAPPEETPPPPDPAAEPIPQPAPAPKPPAPKPAPRYSGITPLPDIEFKMPAAKRSDFPSGSAEPGYLSKLYGMIVRRMPAQPKQSRPAQGRVVFGVMSNGQIFQEAVAIPSGAPFLDAAALAAVRKAAPFPPPPKGGPVYIRFDYGTR